MKLAVTADFHLTTEADHPERYETLRLVLRQCGKLDIEALFIAGDLFDRQQHNFADFEASLRAAQPPNLEVVILPGNHDSALQPAALAVEGVRLVAEPKLLQIGDDLQLLLIPYQAGTTMGEQLAVFQDQLEAGRWLLISHSDWLGGQRKIRPEEPGVYMPLTQRDLSLFQPLYCLLGHIHHPVSNHPIYYAGSPCPLDITETGRRRLLIFDGNSQSLASEFIDSPQIFFNEKIVMLPVADEAAYLADQLEAIRRSWQLPEELHERVVLRLQLAGYSTDRASLLDIIDSTLSDIKFEPGSPDVSQVQLATDPDRAEIAKRVEAEIGAMRLEAVAADLDFQSVLEQALAVIYGS